jgi:hypothetical protein
MALLATAGLASTAGASNDAPGVRVSSALPDRARPTPARTSPANEAVARVGSENRTTRHPDLTPWYAVAAGIALAFAFGALRRRRPTEVSHPARRQHRPRGPPTLLPV